MDLCCSAITPVPCPAIVVEDVSIEVDSGLRQITRACNRPEQRERGFVCDNCRARVRVQGSCVSRIMYSCVSCGRLVGLDRNSRLSVLQPGDVRMAVAIYA